MTWRTLLARAATRPAIDEPLDAVHLRGFWAMTRAMAVIAFVFDIGLWLSLRGDPHIEPRTVDTFAAINLPALALMFALGRAAAHRQVPAVVPALTMLLAHLTVVVWVQATGTLSSYFMVAGAMLVAAHRALLSWTMGVASLGILLALHGGAVALEELGVLARAPLYTSAPGAVYDAGAMRASVFLSIASVYGMTWLGGNLLVANLRATQRALDNAERRLAAAADNVREGRLTGHTVAGYRLHEVIGRGGMAEVYRGVRAGEAAATAPAVAVKVMHPHLVDDEHLVARLRREAMLASRLPPAVTAAVREVHLAGPGERVVVLDLLHGEDLAARLRRLRKLPVDDAVALLVAICAAVEVVHAAGIVHRDLKPHNLFLLDDGTVRVLDFGIARARDDQESLTQTAAVLGTPGYIAPEMAEAGAAALGPEADVYALGVIGFQLLTGERPAALESTSGRSSGDAPRPARLVPAVGPALDAVIALAMARSPSRRYRTVAAFAADLAHAVAGTLPPEVVRKADPAAGGSLEDTFVARPSA